MITLERSGTTSRGDAVLSGDPVILARFDAFPGAIADGVGRVDGIGRGGVFSSGPIGLLGEFVTGARLGVEGRLVDSPSAPDGVTGLGAGFVVNGFPTTGVLLGFGRATGCGPWVVGRVVDGLFMVGFWVAGVGAAGRVEAGADGRLVEGVGFGVSTIGRLIGAVGAGDGLLPSMRSRLLGLPLPIGGRATGVFFVGAFSVVDGRVGLVTGRADSGCEGPADSASDLPTGFGFVAGAGTVDSGGVSPASLATSGT